MVLDDKIKNERTGIVTEDYGFVSETAQFVSFFKKNNLFLSTSWPSLIIRKAFLMSEIIVNLLDLKYKRSFSYQSSN